MIVSPAEGFFTSNVLFEVPTFMRSPATRADEDSNVRSDNLEYNGFDLVTAGPKFGTKIYAYSSHGLSL